MGSRGFLGLTVAAVCVGSATAQIVSVGGAVVEVSAPPSVTGDAYQHDTEIRIFHERQEVTGAAVTVNVTTPGFVNSGGTLSAGVIAAGTLMSSYYLIWDPATGTRRASGSATFAQDILGIVVLTGDLTASNWLGAPGTLYPTSGLVGLELGDDRLTLSSDRRTVSVDFNASTPGDRIRIITGPQPVPEPFTLGLAGLGLATALRRRKRR